MGRQQLGTVWRALPRWFRLLVVSTVGFTLLVLGSVMLVLPGPGVLVLLAAFLVLGLEFAWAERFVNVLRARAANVRPGNLRRNSGNRSDVPATAPGDDLGGADPVAGDVGHGNGPERN